MLVLSRTLAFVALALSLACDRPNRDPKATVERYFAWIADDPSRTLDLLAPSFHPQHGLRVDALEGAFWGGGRTTADPARFSLLSSGDREAVDRGRLAWLFVLRHAVYRSAARRLEATWVGGRSSDREAFVTVRVREQGVPALLQRFHLDRPDAESPWRVLAIEQVRVTPGNASTAFVAFPNVRNLKGWTSLRRKSGVGEQDP